MERIAISGNAYENGVGIDKTNKGKSVLTGSQPEFCTLAEMDLGALETR